MEVDKYAELYKQRNKHKIKKKYFFFLFLLIAIFTNPSDEKHQAAVRDKFDNYVQKHSGKPLAFMQGNPFLDQSIKNSVSASNYIILSTTNVVWDNRTHVIGVGLFGKVFIFSSVDTFLNQRF